MEIITWLINAAFIAVGRKLTFPWYVWSQQLASDIVSVVLVFLQ